MSRFLFSVANEYFRMREPLQIGGVRTDEREVVYIGAAALEDPDFPLRTGEAAPLPGLHDESVVDVMEGFDGEAQDAVFADSLEACHDLLASQPPSLRFALESIRLGWQAHQQGTVPARVLRTDARAHVDVCALISAGGDMAVPAAAKAVKVKVGRRSAADEREALRALLDTVAGDVEIRLDANRAWSLDEAVARLEGLNPARIAYVEEPLADPAELPAFHARTGLHVALDESLHEAQHEVLCSEEAVAAFVVKPSRCGIFQTLAWDARAVASGKRVVISSCFESGVGLGMLAQVAAALRSHDGAAGLGTATWFETPPSMPGYDADALRFTIEEWTGS